MPAPSCRNSMSDRNTASRQPKTPGVGRTGLDRVDSMGFTIGFQGSESMSEGRQRLIYDIRRIKAPVFTDTLQWHNINCTFLDTSTCTRGVKERKPRKVYEVVLPEHGTRQEHGMADVCKQFKECSSMDNREHIILLLNRTELSNRSANGFISEQRLAERQHGKWWETQQKIENKLRLTTEEKI